MTVASSKAGSWFWRVRHGEFDQARMLSATAASDEDFSLRFPLHVLVWENDYRKLERELQTVCVRYPQMLMYADSMKLMVESLIWLLRDFCLLWMSWHACHVFSNLVKLDLVHYWILLQMLHQLAIHLLATALLYCIALESWWAHLNNRRDSFYCTMLDQSFSNWVPWKSLEKNNVKIHLLKIRW